jgi:ribose-phosphate pyrophosphokinase
MEGDATRDDGAPLLLAMTGNDDRAAALAAGLGGVVVERLIRHFPDGETFVRLDSPVAGRDVAVVCTLDHADHKLVPVLLLAATARDLGARSVTLVAPYLGYMRQDARFHPGEGVTSLYVGALLSHAFDGLVTIDPHLHRHAALADVYSIPHVTATAGPAIGEWVRANVARPLLVGPDAESEQWVSAAAGDDVPYVIFTKVRSGDHDVAIEAPDLTPYADRTPVLVDDVLSTGRTMIGAAEILTAAGFAAPICAAVHGVFSGDAVDAMNAAGLTRIVTCDTVPHPTNRIAATPILVTALRELLATRC